MVDNQIVGRAAIGASGEVSAVVAVLPFDDGGILPQQAFDKGAEQQGFHGERQAGLGEMHAHAQPHPAFVLRDKENGNAVFATVWRKIVDACQPGKGKGGIVYGDAPVEQFADKPVLPFVEDIAGGEAVCAAALAHGHALPTRIAQQAAVDIGRVGGVEKIFYGVDKVPFHLFDGVHGFKTGQRVEIGIGRKRHIGRKAHPHPAAVFAAGIGGHGCGGFAGTHSAGHGAHAARRVELPAVVAALQPARHDFARAQRHMAVRAAVVETHRLPAKACQHQRLPQQFAGKRFVFEFGGRHQRIPGAFHFGDVHAVFPLFFQAA